MDVIDILRWVLLPAATSTMLSVGLVLAVVRLWRRSRPAGATLAIGLAVRTAAALVLFWTSYLQLPLARSLQLGGGFWAVAPDATLYHAVSLHGAEDGLSTLQRIGSMGYVVLLTCWMKVFGLSVFSGVLLNLACYVTAGVLLARVLLRLPRQSAEPATVICLGAMAGSPMLVFVSTQVLKDALFMLCSVLLAVGAWWLGAWLDHGHRRVPMRQALPGIAAIVVGILGTAGIRTYYAAIALGCLALMLAIPVLLRPRPILRRWAAASTLALTCGTAAIVAVPDDPAIPARAFAMVKSPFAFSAVVQRSREGFATSGGTTNVAAEEGERVREVRNRRVSPRPVRRRGEVQLPAPALELSPAEHARAALVGLATLVVPVTLLRALSVVDIQPSAAQLFGDLDTVLFDASLVAIVLLIGRLRRQGPVNRPYAAFATAMGILLVVLMAYVVTNVGTIVRLRLMVTVPLWTLPLVFARSPYAAADEPPPA